MTRANGEKKDASAHPANAMPGASYSLRLAAFYGAMFVILGVHLPYLPVWLDARGLTASEIAIVTAAPFFLRVFVTPFAAMIADRTGWHRRLINGLAWTALLLALLLSQMQSFWAILLVAVPFAISLSTQMPLTEAVAVAGVRTHALDYGRMRLWGSLTFVAAGFAGGWLIDRAGTEAVIGCLLVGLVATAICAAFLPEKAPTDSPPPSWRSHAPHGLGEGLGVGGIPTTIVLESPPPNLPHKGGGETARADVWRLLASPVFLAFLLAVGATQAAHAMFYAFGALAWQAQGISTVWIGALWAIAIVGEVALFAWSGNVVRRWGPVALMVGSAVAGALRWTIMGFAPPLGALVLLQTLHTLTYGASHIAAIHFIARAVPESAQATAQALYSSTAMGVLMGGATLTSGFLYARIGSETYFAMAALTAAGLAAALYVRARWSGGLLWEPEEKPVRT